MSHRTISRFLLLLALTITASGLTAASAVADAPEAGTGMVLSDANSSSSGQLIAGGSFAYFFFNTPGAKKPVLLTLDVDKSKLSGGEGQMGDAIGFDVYRVSDGAWVAHSGAVANDPTATTAFAAVSSNSKSPVLHLAVVHNYSPLSPNYTMAADFSPMAAMESNKEAPVLQPGQYAVGRVEGDGGSSNVLLSLGDVPFLPLVATVVASNAPKSLTMGFGDKPGQPKTGTQSKLAVNLWSGSKLLACSGPKLGSGMNPVKKFGGVTCTGSPVVFTADAYGNAGQIKGPTDVRYVTWDAGAMNTSNGDKTEIGLQVLDSLSASSSGSMDFAVRFDRKNLPLNP